jgi:catechol 2,3-dioxygenase-like lactoylglutathione lyase family enzyme
MPRLFRTGASLRLCHQPPSCLIPAGVKYMTIAHLTLATHDVARSQAFFAATLGWRPIERPNNIGQPAAWLAIAPGQELHLIEVSDFKPSPFEEEYGRHVAIEFDAREFATLKSRLAGHGAELIEPLRATPFERFFFKDPNGYVFEVVAAHRQSEAGNKSN